MEPKLIDEDPRDDFQSLTAPNYEFSPIKFYGNLGLRVGFFESVLGFFFREKMRE